MAASTLDNDFGVIQIMNKADFDSHLADHELVVVMYGARWSLSCVVGALAYMSYASRSIYSALSFLKIDVTDSPQLANQAGLFGIPTWHFYRKGKQVAEMCGHDPSSLKRKLNELADVSNDGES